MLKVTDFIADEKVTTGYILQLKEQEESWYSLVSVELKKHAQAFSIFIVAKLEIGNLKTYIYTYYVNSKWSYFGKLKLDLALLLRQTGRENFAISNMQTLLNMNLCENYHPH